MEFIKQPWPWYLAGPLIGLIVPALLLLGNKAFGISSSLRHICAACLPAGILFFKYDWKKESWNLFFVAGIVLGGFMAVHFLSNAQPVAINPATTALLQKQGVKDFTGLLPLDIFSFSQLLTLRGLVFMVLGGFLVGFGTRYAGGCTSGHAIMGISSLQWPSFVATCCFMAGGFIMAWFILPHLLAI
ncbi:YeeE/YedE family protein [Mucilaginibacter psychrotolerans]|uniref:YeeE/YedE family protein n=1 Tax=Mucilaginibacter psychrotolerans TaxID=1524096 RepID=A0A4Y8SHD5_9SPHI|nr:YeeE/YedE thiosulfate transporter family protein [Mucilaginibacter psychrotolerans]TFF38040.1 YeeE/YedE family protein [Mucilaginibacter psychrotolerans]